MLNYQRVISWGWDLRTKINAALETPALANTKLLTQFSSALVTALMQMISGCIAIVVV